MSPDHPDTEIPSGTLFSPLLEAAVRLAARGHYRQFRKHSADNESGNLSGDFLPDRVPYIAHLMGTMCILARIGVRDEVLDLVVEVTEHKRRELDQADTWEIRKQEQLDHIEGMPRDAVLIKAADVLHNLLSLLADLEAADDPALVWQPFNAGPDRQLWYFTAVVERVERRLAEHPLVDELRSAADRLRPFVKD